MTSILKMQDIDLGKQRVLIREDYNVPIENGRVMSDARLNASIPTLKRAIEQHAAVMVLSHLGRPKEGVFDPQFSLEPVAKRLAKLCPDLSIRFVRDWLDGVNLQAGEIVLCENVRFNVGEKNNDAMLAKKMAKLCDVFVMDAFATAHRSEASTCGIAQFASLACAGPLLLAELEALTNAFAHPARPLVAIVAGSKVSTKLTVLTALIDKVDCLILGGGIANTFLAAQGHEIGASLYEADLLDVAKTLMALAHDKKVHLLLPSDVVVSTVCSAQSVGTHKTLQGITAQEMILDVGPQTRQEIHEVLQKASTIIWNGPLGVFELSAFEEGTKALAASIAESSAYSLAGGGDTLAAIEKYRVQDRISYLSTGGGAFLEFLENKKLPVISALEESAKR
jgi:phosphoglycerate kinase